MTTNVTDDFVLLETGRTLKEKLAEMVSVTDYGADINNSAAANTTAINAAIAAVSSGYVIVPYGISYTEANLVFGTGNDVTLIVLGNDGVITFLSAAFASTPVLQGGIAIKQQGVTGVLLRAVNFGVAAEPFLQVVDLANGDVAATHTKFIELDEIAAPANPSANKSRLYTRDNGSGKTQLVVQFPTGAVQVLATEP